MYLPWGVVAHIDICKSACAGAFLGRFPAFAAGVGAEVVSKTRAAAPTRSGTRVHAPSHDRRKRSARRRDAGPEILTNTRLALEPDIYLIDELPPALVLKSTKLRKAWRPRRVGMRLTLTFLVAGLAALFVMPAHSLRQSTGTLDGSTILSANDPLDRQAAEILGADLIEPKRPPASAGGKVGN